jgi:hypothetical protein
LLSLSDLTSRFRCHELKFSYQSLWNTFQFMTNSMSSKHMLLSLIQAFHKKKSFTLETKKFWMEKRKYKGKGKTSHKYRQEKIFNNLTVGFWMTHLVIFRTLLLITRLIDEEWFILRMHTFLKSKIFILFETIKISFSFLWDWWNFFNQIMMITISPGNSTSTNIFISKEYDRFIEKYFKYWEILSKMIKIWWYVT